MNVSELPAPRPAGRSWRSSSDWAVHCRAASYGSPGPHRARGNSCSLLARCCFRPIAWTGPVAGWWSTPWCHNNNNTNNKFIHKRNKTKPVYLQYRERHRDKSCTYKSKSVAKNNERIILHILDLHMQRWRFECQSRCPRRIWCWSRWSSRALVRSSLICNPRSVNSGWWLGLGATPETQPAGTSTAPTQRPGIISPYDYKIKFFK